MHTNSSKVMCTLSNLSITMKRYVNMRTYSFSLYFLQNLFCSVPLMIFWVSLCHSVFFSPTHPVSLSLPISLYFLNLYFVYRRCCSIQLAIGDIDPMHVWKTSFFVLIAKKYYPWEIINRLMKVVTSSV